MPDSEEENENESEEEESEEGSEEESEEESEDEEGEGKRERKQGMHWHNEPEEWSQHRTTVVMRVPPKTDFWRKTGTDTVVDNAPFYGLEVEGDFEVRVKVKANYENPGDQAGVMVREDDENWTKLGIHMIGDVPHMCATVTHDYSDMSMHPLPHLPDYMWVHAKKIGDGLEVYISEDSFDWIQIRQGDIVDDAILQVGIFAASPNSDDGFEVTFEDFMIKDEER
jgi:regulation of enolase protein 1 (concanavalin A-like superfamily)